jgi:hypothetical protein
MTKVTNLTNMPIQASINQWGSDGDTSWFNISSSNTETWDRSDPRGYVLSLSVQGSTSPFYVFGKSNVTVQSDGVFRDGEAIFPLQ